MMWKLASLITVALALVVPAHAQENAPEPEGYRTDNYRAPVPATLAGARVLSTAEAEAIWRDKTAVFIDVLPRPPKPQGLPAGTVWRDKPRLNIPAASGCRTPVTGRLRQRPKTIYGTGLSVLPAATMQGCS